MSPLSPLISSMLLMTLGLGTMITFSSTSWFMAWIGLEINTIAIIPLMVSPYHPRSVEAATKYFIVQSAGSATLLIAACMTAWNDGNWAISQQQPLLVTIIMASALIMKLGMAPMHFWFTEVMAGLNLTTGMIMATWQKLAPLILLIQILQNQNSLFILIPALLSVMVGGWGGLNQTQNRKIMAYSSIAHMGWIVSIAPFNPSITWLMMCIYCLLTIATFLNLHALKAYKINSITSNTHNKTTHLFLIVTLLSLGGLPPLTGFINKLESSIELMNQGLILFLFIMIMFSLLSLYFYTRLCYLAISLSPPSPNVSTSLWRTQPNKPAFMLTLLSFSLLLLTPQMLAVFALY
uniref:NADH dehydrogenase subunit 2 n=1 Tax=Mordacia mordax TaxID=7755 RepID=UPI0022DCDFC1|nr:NADH dehydrogenase subunit 2 [Mordacia mordax]YP_010587548.1 NADH dehydrogenase subunit 2 [Mordacia praecox]WAB46092.1 NADH dehydrogenase subunit 2 [Mordacia mordax]WAB46105.1 NADH dehydrogenase subunit 2 [Mordacia praecox]